MQDTAQINPLETVLNVIVYDQSESAKYVDCDTVEIEKLIRMDAHAAQVWVAGIRVLDKNSIQQKPIIKGPMHLDLTSEKEYSIYQSSEIQASNAITISNFREKLSHLLAQFDQQMLSIRDLPYSDIKGALQLTETLCQQARFKNASIRLIVLSDLLHDLPGDKDMGSFSFPSNTTIYTTGVSPQVDLASVFPDNRVNPIVQFTADFLDH